MAPPPRPHRDSCVRVDRPLRPLILSRSRSPIAQLVEQAAVNRCVAGSSPARGATLSLGAERGLRRSRLSRSGAATKRGRALFDTCTQRLPYAWTGAPRGQKQGIAIDVEPKVSGFIQGRPRGVSGQTPGEPPCDGEEGPAKHRKESGRHPTEDEASDELRPVRVRLVSRISGALPLSVTQVDSHDESRPKRQSSHEHGADLGSQPDPPTTL